MTRILKDERDYGRFISSRLFTKLFPNYGTQQAQAAKELVSRVFSQCHGKFDFPRIETLVDLGCGNGAFLLGIKCAIDAYNRGIAKQFRVPIKKYVGLDVSENVIRQARRKSLSLRASVQFEPVASEVSGLVTAFEKQRVRGESTALLVLSHTWFHFQNQEALLAEIDKLRPALILLDIFHSWDATLSVLQHSHWFDEPISNKGGVFVLRTEKHGKDKVWRGVSEIEPAHGKRQWRFRTNQTRIGTDWLFGTRKSLANLSTARIAGHLTGAKSGHKEIRCDYVRCQKFLYLTGWGFMDCHVLLSIDPNARVLNQAFHEVIANVVRNHLLDGPTQQLLNFFRNPRKQIPRCEAAIIQPFDQNRAFARFVKLNRARDDNEISKHDTILELPESSQRNYPTAYGLYHTMICRVSSMQAFPLSWAPNYEHAEVDLRFSDLENRLLDLDQHDSDPSFFIVPIYFGSLPLLALIVESPTNFPAATSDSSVYQSTLINLHDQIRLVFDDTFLQTQILSPFIARSLDALLKKERQSKANGTQSSSGDDIPRHLKTIEKHLRQALAKDWKSWILSTPSQPINTLASVAAENKRLLTLWDEEKRRALKDDELHISYWFQKGRFFEACDCLANGLRSCRGNAHDDWCANSHPDRLNHMLALLRHGAGGITNSPYFERSRGSYLLAWAAQQITALQAEAAQDAKTEVYRDLKAVFCKTWENRGDSVRFSTRRLYCTLKAAAATSPTQVEFDPAQSTKVDGWLAVDGEKLFSRSDPTNALGNFLEPLAKIKRVKRVAFTRRSPTEIAITIAFDRRLYGKRGGGQTFSAALDAWRRLSPYPGSFIGKKFITLPIQVTRDQHNLSFTPKAL